MNNQQSNTNNKGSVPLFSSNGNIVATAKTDRRGWKYVWKSIDASRHALRTPPALAMDATVIDQAEAMGCVSVLVKDRESGTLYSTKLENFRLHGIPLNRGFGRQYALTFNYWDERGNDGTVTKKNNDGPKPPPPVAPALLAQAPLFGQEVA